MDISTAQALIDGGESLTVEFKSDRQQLPDADLVDTAVCMANAEGGALFVGVEDDGAITGLHVKHRASPDLLAAFVASRTVPPLTVEASFVQMHAGDDGLIAHIRIPAATQTIATSDGRMLVRYIDVHGEPGCRPLYPHELQSWQGDRGQADTTAATVSGASFDELDPLEFVRLRRMIEEYRGDATLLDLSDGELARALGLVTTVERELIPTIAGLLLVGKEAALRDRIPAHEVAFQVLRDTDVLVNDFYRGPLLRILEQIWQGFDARNEEREFNTGLFRVGIPAYDEAGFREALNNALTHRDYRRLGAVHVQMHVDAVRISNPGGFLQGVRPDNLLAIEPKPRNPRLADCFKRIGLVERTGRGVGIIYRGQLRNGRRPPSYELSSESSVNVQLPGGTADLDFVEMIVAKENAQQRSLPVAELLILDHVRRERQIDRETAKAITQQTESAARSSLESLIENDLLERRGSRRNLVYQFSASVYRNMGKPEAYIRAKGFDSLQMERMIVQYIESYGRITRAQVAELCRISDTQANYLLKTLRQKDLLLLMGSGRSAHYILSGTNKN